MIGERMELLEEAKSHEESCRDRVGLNLKFPELR